MNGDGPRLMRLRPRRLVSLSRVAKLARWLIFDAGESKKPPPLSADKRDGASLCYESHTGLKHPAKFLESGMIHRLLSVLDLWEVGSRLQALKQLRKRSLRNTAPDCVML